MAKKFSIVFMMLALGLFVVPKQMLFGQTAGMSCCQPSKQKKDDCCKTNSKDKPCHDSKDSNNSEKGCGDKCTSCTTCHYAAVVFILKTEERKQDTKIHFTEKQEAFTYITPEISDIFANIWQPPKIG